MFRVSANGETFKETNFRQQCLLVFGGLKGRRCIRSCFYSCFSLVPRSCLPAHFGVGAKCHDSTEWVGEVCRWCDEQYFRTSNAVRDNGGLTAISVSYQTTLASWDLKEKKFLSLVLVLRNCPYGSSLRSSLRSNCCTWKINDRHYQCKTVTIDTLTS